MAPVERYYGDKIALHGPTPAGVDWSSLATQHLRFTQLLAVCDFSGPFSLDDLGCGYGAVLDWLDQSRPGHAVDYLGIDLSRAMVLQARALWRRRPQTKFRIGRRSPRQADYAIASGIFNVKLDAATEAWERNIAGTLAGMRRTSLRGFAVNLLAPLPDHLAQPRQLYRCDPAKWMDYCRSELDCNVQLRGGYGLSEYTLLLRPR